MAAACRTDPAEVVEQLARDILAVLTAAEARLLADIARRARAGADVPDWAAQKAAAVREVGLAVERMLTQLRAEVDTSAAEAVLAAWQAGSGAALAQLADLDALDEPQLVALRDVIPGMDAAALLAADLTSRLDALYLRVLRWGQDTRRLFVMRYRRLSGAPRDRWPRRSAHVRTRARLTAYGRPDRYPTGTAEPAGQPDAPRRPGQRPDRRAAARRAGLAGQLARRRGAAGRGRRVARPVRGCAAGHRRQDRRRAGSRRGAPTVEQVTEQRGAAQREARERAVDLAVYRSAPAAGADPDALLDSASFRKRVADLDPSAADFADFADKVTAAITASVQANPRLAAAPAAAPRSGGQITGGSPTGPDDLGSLSVEDYVKRTRKGRS